MSFRNRLTLFFVVIVIVPMIAVALVLFRLIADSETGKSDAGVAEAARTAAGLYRLGPGGARARGAILRIAADAPLATALGKNDFTAAQRRAAMLVASGGITRLQITRGSSVIADAGDQKAIAPITRDLIGVNKAPLGRLYLSVHEAKGYAALVH